MKIHTEKIIHKTGSSPFSLHRTVIEPEQNNALYLHCHPEAEFFLLEEGWLDFYVESTCFRLQKGDGIFIPHGMLHNAIRPEDCVTEIIYSAIVFSTEPMERCISGGRTYFDALACHRQKCIYPILPEKEENRKLLSGIRDILNLRNTDPATCELTIQGLLFVCWQELYNIYLSGLIEASGDTDLCRNLSKSIDYMQKHYSDTLSLEQLAELSGYSESYYCHSFHAYTGSAPFEYFNRIRIAKACEMLSSTHKKITEIASLVGFNNISYFNRMFTKIMGVTPSAYRKG